MPLQNSTQKYLKLGPDFRRDDDKGRDERRGRDFLHLLPTMFLVKIAPAKIAPAKIALAKID